MAPTELSSGPPAGGCDTTCGGLGASCGALLNLLSCEDVSALNCNCGTCCGKNEPPLMPPPPPDMPRVPLATFNNFTDECSRSEWRRKMTVCARSYNGVTTDEMDVGSAVGVGLAVGLSIMAVLLAASSMYRTWHRKQLERRQSQQPEEVSGVVLSSAL